MIKSHPKSMVSNRLLIPNRIRKGSKIHPKSMISNRFWLPKRIRKGSKSHPKSMISNRFLIPNRIQKSSKSHPKSITSNRFYLCRLRIPERQRQQGRGSRVPEQHGQTVSSGSSTRTKRDEPEPNCARVTSSPRFIQNRSLLIGFGSRNGSRNDQKFILNR